MHPLPPPLPDDVLALRHSLPLKVAPVTLEGTRVRLQPLIVERDLAALYAHTNGQAITLGARSIPAYDADALVWRFMSQGPFADSDALAVYLHSLVTRPDGLALVVLDQATQAPIGLCTYMSNVPEHLKIELGSISYSPIAQGTGANTEATYLLLQHAFALGYRRVEWKCHVLNERSRRSALRMGFTFEGIHEAHVILKGRSRDTAWFRMLSHEWPSAKARLEALLAR